MRPDQRPLAFVLALVLAACATEDPGGGDPATETNFTPIECGDDPGRCADSGTFCARIETSEGTTLPICVLSAPCGDLSCQSGECAKGPGEDTQATCVAERVESGGGTQGVAIPCADDPSACPEGLECASIDTEEGPTLPICVERAECGELSCVSGRCARVPEKEPAETTCVAE